MTTKNPKPRRYEANLLVSYPDQPYALPMVTENVHLNGAFINTDAPGERGQLLQLEFTLPSHHVVHALVKVKERFAEVEDSPDKRGMEVEFFAINKEARTLWKRFIEGLEEGSFHSAVREDPWVEALKNTQPTRRQHIRHQVCFMVQVEDQEQLNIFYTFDISLGGMFLKTPYLREVGEEIELILLHPDTQDEFPLSGVVVHVSPDDSDGKGPGMGIKFKDLPKQKKLHLHEFILTGVNYLAPPPPAYAEKRDKLRVACLLAPDSPHVHFALGETLASGPGEREELEEALEAYNRVLELDPDFIEAHQGICKVHARLGRSMPVMTKRFDPTQHTN